MEKRRNTKRKSDSLNRNNGNRKSGNTMFDKKRNFEGGQKRNEFHQRKPRTEKPKTQESKYSLGEKRALCSFFVYKNADANTLLRSVEKLSYSVEKIVVSIPSQSESLTDTLKATKCENISIREYNDECEHTVHNCVFNEFTSDIFVIANSNIEPREYSVDILQKYLTHENVVATVPTVYNKDLQLNHYCLRFSTLLSSAKILFGLKSEANRLIMMERGESGYYRIHRVDASKSQLVVINSLAFKTIGMFPTCGDSFTRLFQFYKNIMKCGMTLFVPTARIIEHSEKTPTRSIVSRICYMMCNVF